MRTKALQKPREYYITLYDTLSTERLEELQWRDIPSNAKRAIHTILMRR